jgi:hypothetical protein
MGHKIGRKVGDMLELVVMAKIYADKDLSKRIVYEPKLLGATGAGHKVEFAFFESDQSPVDGKPFGFIECKKVGVEVTKHSLTKDGLLVLSLNEVLKIPLTRAWMVHDLHFELSVTDISDAGIEVSTQATSLQPNRITLVPQQNIKLVVTEDGVLHILGPEDSLRQIPGIVRICKYLRFEAIKGGSSTWSLWDCLTGPQTIEKAKQASLVAMDVRKRVDGQWGRDDLTEEQKTITSILVLTEASHWEEKSRKVITLCVDHTIIIPDEIIVEAFKIFEKEFGTTAMLNVIKKSEYLSNEKVRLALSKLLSKFPDKLFYDLNLGEYVDFKYSEGKLVVFSLRVS